MRSDAELAVVSGSSTSEVWLQAPSRVLARPLRLSGPTTPDSIGARIRSVCAGKTCSEVSEATGYCPESVRRYRKGDPPPAGFVLRLARATSTSIDWLLIGRGPRLRSEVCESQLSQLPLSRVLGELSQRHGTTADAEAIAAQY